MSKIKLLNQSDCTKSTLSAYLFENEEISDCIFKIVLVLFTVLLCTKCISGEAGIDSFEHVHATWLVSQGFVPYRDFFEHHNPLLWYLFTPLLYITGRSMYFIYVAYILTITAYMFALKAIYMISLNIFNNKNIARLAIMIFISFSDMCFDMTTFRPDAFMLLCFFYSINCFLQYMDTGQRKQLVISYLLMSLSFLFLQKIVFMQLAFVAVNFTFLLKKRIGLADMMYAAIIAAVPLVFYIGYLIYSHSFAAWFYYNFAFNANMRDYYDNVHINTSYYPLYSYLSVLLLFFYYKYSEKKLLLLSLVLASFCSLVCFAPLPWYYLPFIMTVCPFLSDMVYRIKYKLLFYLIVTLILALDVRTIYSISPFSIPKKNYDYALGKYITDNTTPEDKVLSFSHKNYNLFTKNAHYYWFGWRNVVVVDFIYNEAADININDIIKDKTAKFVIFDNQPDELVELKTEWFGRRASHLYKKLNRYTNMYDLLDFVHISDEFYFVDKRLLRQNYKRSRKFRDLWQRKEEE